MPFDGIVTKAITSELNNICPCKIEKILQPDKNTIILCVYSNRSKYNINISLDSQNYRLSLTNNIKQVPANAYNFCMLLRKHISGLKIQNFTTNSLERIVTINFEGFDEYDDIVTKKLVIELMGKHCNCILLDETGYIIDSIRHIAPSDDNHRNIYPKAKYTLPATTKHNFLEISSFEDFYSCISPALDTKTIDLLDISKIVSDCFTGFSFQFVNALLPECNSTSLNFLDTLNELYVKICDVVNNLDVSKFAFFEIESTSKKDYCLKASDISSSTSLNYALDTFYFNKENCIKFTNLKNTLFSKINELRKKYVKRLSNMEAKLKECDNMDSFRIYGELLTSNLYNLPTKNMSEVTVPNYYDDNTPITIELNSKFVPSINAKLFFKKYNKLKNTLRIVSIQKIETIHELEYIESLVYQLESASTISDLDSISSELQNTDILDISNKIKVKENNKKTNKKNSQKSTNSSPLDKFNPLVFTIDNLSLSVGKNNFENDFLTLKQSRKTDLWFHVKDFPGSHCVLSLSKDTIPNDTTLTKCAQIAAYYSKCKDSSNVLVDYCLVKYVKKPNKSRPGMVIYTDNKTLRVDPSNNF